MKLLLLALATLLAGLAVNAALIGVVTDSATPFLSAMLFAGLGRALIAFRNSQLNSRKIPNETPHP